MFSFKTLVLVLFVIAGSGSARADEAAYEGSPFFGWTCKSMDPSHLIYVDVEQVSRGGLYAMRVTASSNEPDSGPRNIASFSKVSLSMTDSDIDFSGDTQQLHGELRLDQRGGRLNDLSSVLRLSGRVPAASGFEIPLDTSIPLVCDRTR